MIPATMLLGLGLLLAPSLEAGSASTTKEPSVALSVEIGSIALPDRKRGLREVRFALGKEAEGAIVQLIGEVYTSRRAFARVGGDSPDVRLDLAIEEVRQEWTDNGAQAESGSPFALRFTATGRFFKGEALIFEAPLDVTASRVMRGTPRRHDIAQVMAEGIRDLGLTAFAGAFEGGAFGEAGRATTWIEVPSGP